MIFEKIFTFKKEDSAAGYVIIGFADFCHHVVWRLLCGISFLQFFS